LSVEGERESLFVDAFMLADRAAGAEAVADEEGLGDAVKRINPLSRKFVPRTVPLSQWVD
jgi:hypothetical protein